MNSVLTTTIALSAVFAGEVSGTVKFIGKGPKAKPIRMDADPVCAASHQTAAKAESFIMDKDGKQWNVNKTLISEGHAYVYDGGKKKVFTS